MLGLSAPSQEWFTATDKKGRTWKNGCFHRALHTYTAAGPHRRLHFGRLNLLSGPPAELQPASRCSGLSGTGEKELCECAVQDLSLARQFGLKPEQVFVSHSVQL